MFEFEYRDGNSPTMGDVIAAIKGVEDQDWSFRRAIKNHQQFDFNGGRRGLTFRTEGRSDTSHCQTCIQPMNGKQL